MIENSLNPDPCFETRHVILGVNISKPRQDYRRVSTKSHLSCSSFDPPVRHCAFRLAMDHGRLETYIRYF